MAITVTNRAIGLGTEESFTATISGYSYGSGNFVLFLVYVANSLSSVTGGGLTWDTSTPEANTSLAHNGITDKVVAIRGYGTCDGTNITITTSGGTEWGMIYSLNEITGQNGNDFVVESVTENTDTGNNSSTAFGPAFSDADNYSLVCHLMAVSDTTSSITHGGNLTSLGANNYRGSFTAHFRAAGYDGEEDPFTASDANSNGTATWASIGLELDGSGEGSSSIPQSTQSTDNQFSVINATGLKGVLT